MQLRPVAAQILSGPRLLERTRRLGNVQRERQREAELRVSLHSEATQQGGVDAVLTPGGTEPVRAPVFIVGAQARKRKGRERERVRNTMRCCISGFAAQTFWEKARLQRGGGPRWQALLRDASCTQTIQELEGDG